MMKDHRAHYWLILVIVLLRLTLNLSNNEHQTNETVLSQTPVAVFGNTSVFISTSEGVFLFPKEGSRAGASIEKFGQWEKPIKDLARMFIRGFVISRPEEEIIIFEIGSNFGAWTIPLSDAIKDRGKLYAFEWQSEMIALLHANTLMNRAINIIPIHAVVGNPAASSQSYMDSTDSGLVSHETAASPRKKHIYKIRKLSIDKLYADSEIPCPHFVRVDAARHEIAILTGAQQIIFECKPVLLIEVNEKKVSRPLIILLDKIGYAMAWSTVSSLDLQHKFSGDPPAKLDEDILIDKHSGSRWLNSAINIVAVPKNQAGVFDHLKPGGLIELIDLTSQRYEIHEYDLEFCYGPHWCSHRSQVDSIASI